MSVLLYEGRPFGSTVDDGGAAHGMPCRVPPLSGPPSSAHALNSPCVQPSSSNPTGSKPATGPTRASSSPPTPSSASCWPASAARTSGTTAASRRSSPGPIGHEFIGVVEDVGADVTRRQERRLRDRAVRLQRRHLPALPARDHDRLRRRRLLPRRTATAARARRSACRSPTARSSRSRAPGTPTRCSRSLLTLSDVMSTGHHAAVCADVQAGSTVAVVGDGAVGLSGVLAAKRLGAERIIALSRHPDRQALAREFGATDIVEQRGDEATGRVMELTDGVGVDATLECVGTGQAMETALVDRAARVDGRLRRRAPRRRAPIERDVLPQQVASAAAPRRRAPTSPSCSTTSSRAASTPAGSSTTRPTSTASPTPTPRWTSAARSSRSFAWGRCDQRQAGAGTSLRATFVKLR